MTSAREIAAATGPLGSAIAQVAHAHRLALVSRLGALGLHPGQELIVVDLHENPDSTQAELVERLGVDQSTVAKALGRMERAGMVTRSRTDTDARVVRSRLTPHGRSLVENVPATWAELDRTVADGLTADEAGALADPRQGPNVVHRTPGDPASDMRLGARSDFGTLQPWLCTGRCGRRLG